MKVLTHDSDSWDFAARLWVPQTASVDTCPKSWAQAVGRGRWNSWDTIQQTCCIPSPHYQGFHTYSIERVIKQRFVKEYRPLSSMSPIVALFPIEIGWTKFSGDSNKTLAGAALSIISSQAMFLTQEHLCTVNLWQLWNSSKSCVCVCHIVNTFNFPWRLRRLLETRIFHRELATETSTNLSNVRTRICIHHFLTFHQMASWASSGSTWPSCSGRGRARMSLTTSIHWEKASREMRSRGKQNWIRQ